MFKVRVAASGQKIAVYKDDKILKVIHASDETFKPAEAVKYAEELNIELQKTAEQMTDPAGPITTPTKAEQQQIDLPKTTVPATGVGGADIMAIHAKLAEAQKAVEALKVENAKLKEASEIERKARRGLAIAKHEASTNKIASTESSLEARVMEITAMSNEDIALLERKTAGIQEFESPTQAMKYASSMKIKARIYRQAAEEAMEDGADDEAVQQEAKAAYCDQRVLEAESFINSIKQAEADDDAMDMEMGTTQDQSTPVVAEDAPIAPQASDDEDQDDMSPTATFDPDNDGDDDSDPTLDFDDDMDQFKDDEFEPQDIIDQVDDQATGKAPNMNYAAQLGSLYSKVAEQHKLIAKLAADDGDDDTAKEAAQEAEDAEKKAAIFTNASADRQAIGNNLMDLYKKIASYLSKVADDAEKDGKEDIADEADQEAKTARRKANTLFQAQNGTLHTATDDDDQDDSKTATADCDQDDDTKTASEEDTDYSDSDKEAAVSEEDNSDATSKIAAISTHSNGVSKIASTEVNKLTFDPSVETLSAQLWGRNTAE